MKKNSPIKAVVVLTVICLVTAMALAIVNHVTAPIIAESERAKENEALKQVLPSGSDFEAVGTDGLGLDESITAVYRESSGEGYVFKLSVKGYKSGMTILCGIGSDGKVDGAVCLSSSETLGHEKSYGDRFNDVGLTEIDLVDTVSGATKTTSAYRAAVKQALEAFKIIKESEESAS